VPARQKKAIQTVSRMFDQVCSPQRGISRETLESVIKLAVAIAREGREGRKIGTMFVVGDSDQVLRRSKALILDPLLGHPDDRKNINDTDMRESLKELAQLDGAFVVSDAGVAISACRYINASAEGIELPLGLGARHVAAASITRDTNAVAVVVSESSVVRVFDNGELIAEIIPELWMLDYYRPYLRGRVSRRREKEVTVVSKEEEQASGAAAGRE
jgi:DNA integrity scanning protein DisA with diadenylate cyclase activity